MERPLRIFCITVDHITSLHKASQNTVLNKLLLIADHGNCNRCMFATFFSWYSCYFQTQWLEAPMENFKHNYL